MVSTKMTPAALHLKFLRTLPQTTDMLQAVATFALFTAVSASCAETPALPECAARGSELLQKHAGIKGAGLQLDATQMMTFEALQRHTSESFAKAKQLRSRRNQLLLGRSDLVSKHQVKSFRRDATCLENVPRKQVWNWPKT